ncbi:Methyltransferase type 11 Precursor [Raphidiopsis brookii D9]|nr:Methyltransferase type 11 Precursor [Raphidiopsis brookii D9]
MYSRIKLATKELDLSSYESCLSISYSKPLCNLIGFLDSQILEANYPQYNICNLDLPSETFDAVVTDQVLEHIECDPCEAINECYRVLKPGGIMVCTTCFMMPFHGSPDFSVSGGGDYWRYTPQGLQFLCRNFSKIIQSDGWGNPLLPILGGLGLVHKPIPDAAWHPLHKIATYDRKSYACVVWIIAQK